MNWDWISDAATWTQGDSPLVDVLPVLFVGCCIVAFLLIRWIFESGMWWPLLLGSLAIWLWGPLIFIVVPFWIWNFLVTLERRGP